MKLILLLFQGGFARVHELKDLNTNERYAGNTPPFSGTQA